MHSGASAGNITVREEMRYDAIVFDLGGVVIDLDRSRCIRAFQALGCADIEADLDQYTQKGDFFGLESGLLTEAAFMDRMRRRCPRADNDVTIQNAFNQFLVDLPVERLRAIRSLRSLCRTFALSNTNPVMYNSWIDRAFRADGLAIGDYFDGIIASFREHCCKPDTRIFQVLIDRYRLDPARVLYLDDAPANVQAAADTGLQAVRVTPDHDMLAIIREAVEA